MRTGRTLIVAAGFALLLAGCVTEGGSYQSYGAAPSGYGYAPGYASPYGSPYGWGGYGRPRTSYDYDEPRRMSGRSMAALAEGCKQRFNPGTNKYAQCVSGSRKSEDSLVEGCTRLYKNDPKAYGRCLQGR
ncbi:hypothetical protein [Azospirillum sp. TSO22-1]|uniref:hypothetical protein n=1 Tax=Azospirillum sp. TSO22-1 TaxID=716789 RepID=UPI000D6043FE|nr:hypothetical protein [Azospirillum sp. TSO22-1]PWC55192.1 hypothetical protein TSO221_06210 [Azospirillum sp. TSO22-1]